ncbi:MAG: D-alanyl-lipoteichoic acid biosynthesis protein DltD [Crocinitomicaceae bacterium]
MSEWAKSNLLLHFVALILAILAIIAGIYGLAYAKNAHDEPILLPIHIKGQQDLNLRWRVNFDETEKAELDLMASLKNRNQLTLFASSELVDEPYCSLNYLPDSLGFPVLAIGHAHHQCLSILAELMAGREYLNDAKVCIVLSPGWFESAGTNAEAFLEFVRPNFLDRIWLDSKIKKSYKIHLGAFIHKNKNVFTSISPEMDRFLNLYRMDKQLNSSGAQPIETFEYQLVQTAKKTFPESFNKIKKIEYDFALAPKLMRSDYSNFEKDAIAAKKDVLGRFSNNSIFVDSNYYTTYISDQNGKHLPGNMDIIELAANDEFEDLKMLLTFLKEQKVNCTFVMQPLNPYHYTNMEINTEAMEKIIGLVKKTGFPLLNLYVNKKEQYEPAILKDVMHFSDYGWMKVSQFLQNTYGEE